MVEKELTPEEQAKAAKAEGKLKGEESAIHEALRVCKVPDKYVVGSRVYPDGSVVFVTVGGKKVRWSKGDKPVELTEIQITGINRELERRRVVAGRKKG